MADARQPAPRQSRHRTTRALPCFTSLTERPYRHAKTPPATRGRSPDTRPLAREPTQPDSARVRTKAHAGQGSRRVGRAPKAAAPTHTTLAPHASSGDTAGSPPNITPASACPSAACSQCSRSSDRRETLGTSPLGFVWSSTEPASCPAVYLAFRRGGPYARNAGQLRPKSTPLSGMRTTAAKLVGNWLEKNGRGG